MACIFQSQGLYYIWTNNRGSRLLGVVVMKAVVLAAGKGTRMEPLTDTRPKVMLPVAGRPILEYLLEMLRDAGISDLVLVTGYMPKRVQDYFGDGSRLDLSIEYVEQTKQLGTAHAIGVAHALVDEAFIALNGDLLLESATLQSFLNNINQDCEAVMALKEVSNPSGLGVIQVDGDRVVKIIEKPVKPPTNLVNAGIYFFQPDIFDAIESTQSSSRDEYEITDTLQNMINADKHVACHLIEEDWIDIGRPWDLLEANEQLLKSAGASAQEARTGDNTTIEPYATLKNPGTIQIGENTIIRNGAYIIGPTVIGNECDIGPNCYIRPYTSIGDNVRIGNAVEIKNSIIMNGTNIGHHSYAGDSIIGERCNFGSGTKVANLRLDEGTIKIKIKRQLINTGRKKLGVIMGDHVHTAINSTLNPGAMLKPNSMVINPMFF